MLPSFSRPACSDDNAFSEALFKTVKYKPSFPAAFERFKDAKHFMRLFVEWYNNEHRHSGINYVTPNQRHEGTDKEIQIKRTQVYVAAQKDNPERWSRNKIRDWFWQSQVSLNPEKNEGELIA